LTYVNGIDIVATNKDDTGVIGDEQFSGPEEEVVDPQMELEVLAVHLTRSEVNIFPFNLACDVFYSCFFCQMRVK